MARKLPASIGRSQARAYAQYGISAARQITLITAFNVMLFILTAGAAGATLYMFADYAGWFENRGYERQVVPERTGLGGELHQLKDEANTKRQRDLDRATGAP